MLLILSPRYPIARYRIYVYNKLSIMHHINRITCSILLHQTQNIHILLCYKLNDTFNLSSLSLHLYISHTTSIQNGGTYEPHQLCLEA